MPTVRCRSLALGLVFAAAGAATLLLAGAAAAQQQAVVTPTLTAGSKAPALAVASWVKGSPIEKFEEGKVYVVEFWATWCGPCRTSIPHLSQLQKEYKDKGVTIIGVTSEDGGLKAVEPYVAKMGEKMDYTVAFDDRRKTGDAWMRAAGQNSIPTAFIVDKSGTVAWIGHPMDGMDDVLAQVVAGTFDTAAHGRFLKARDEYRKRVQEHWRGDRDKAVETILEQVKAWPQYSKEEAAFAICYMAEHKRDYARVKALTEEYTTGLFKDDPTVLTGVARAQTLIADDSQRDLAAARAAADKAVELTHGKDADALEALAGVHAAAGETDAALAAIDKAIAAAPEAKKKVFEERKTEIAAMKK
ncbi:MAG TPA: TlpA disulfide reductase family protein [Phycisphaerales bacterium]|nr:TlpA disulfide reductase family protein [Phycisphaerales bacterium]